MQEIKITVTISAQGEISAETRGIKGPNCITELEKLMQDIIEIQEVSKTDEYYQEKVQLKTNFLSRG